MVPLLRCSIVRKMLCPMQMPCEEFGKLSQGVASNLAQQLSQSRKPLAQKSTYYTYSSTSVLLHFCGRWGGGGGGGVGESQVVLLIWPFANVLHCDRLQDCSMTFNCLALPCALLLSSFRKPRFCETLARGVQKSGVAATKQAPPELGPGPKGHPTLSPSPNTPPNKPCFS